MFALFKHKYPFILLSFPVTGGILWSSHITAFTLQGYTVGILLSLASIAYTFLLSRNFLFQNLSLVLFLFFLAAYRNYSPEVPIPLNGKNYAITGEYTGQFSPDHYIIKIKRYAYVYRLRIPSARKSEIVSISRPGYFPSPPVPTFMNSITTIISDNREFIYKGSHSLR